MPNLGTLTLDLLAKTGNFIGPLDKATRQAKKASTDISKSVATSLSSMAKWGAGIAAGASVAAIAFTKSSLAMADTIGKVAKTAGVTTDTIQEMRHAASLSGIAFGDLDQGMQQFNKRVGELRAGTGSLYTYLSKVDKELLTQIKTARSTDDALDLIFKSMKNVTNESDRAALAAAAFGRSGQRIAIMADEYENLRREARELGLVIDADLIKNAEAANDKMDTLARILKTQVTSALLELAPAIQTVAQGLIDLTPGLQWLLGGAGRADERQKELNAITEEMQNLLPLLREQRDIQTRLLQLKAQGSWYDPNELEQVNSNIETIIESMRDLNAQGKKAADTEVADIVPTVDEGDSWKSFGEVLKATSALNEQKLALREKSNKAIAAEDNRQLAEDIARDNEYQAFIAGIKEQEFNEKIARMQEENAALAELQDAANMAYIENIQNPITRELELHKEKFDKLKAMYNEGSAELTAIERMEAQERIAINREANNMAFNAGQDFFGSMADLTKRFAGEQSAAYKAMFAVAKGFALAKAAIKLGEALAEAGASGPPPYNLIPIALAGAEFATIIADIAAVSFSGAHDKGGFIPYGKWGIAGERGPEIITGPAKVVSTADTAKMMGGGNVRIINVVDPSVITEWAGSDSGERVIMNVIRRNRSEIGAF